MQITGNEWVVSTRYGITKRETLNHASTRVDVSFEEWRSHCFTLYHKRVSYILHMIYRNFIRWKQVEFFTLSGNLLLRGSPFHFVNFFYPFDLKLFFVCTLSTYTSCWEPPLAQLHIIFALFWKKYDVLQSLLNVALEWFISFQHNAKTNCETLKGGTPRQILKKGGEATASFASPNRHPWERGISALFASP